MRNTEVSPLQGLLYIGHLLKRWRARFYIRREEVLLRLGRKARLWTTIGSRCQGQVDLGPSPKPSVAVCCFVFLFITVENLADFTSRTYALLEPSFLLSVLSTVSVWGHVEPHSLSSPKGSFAHNGSGQDVFAFFRTSAPDITISWASQLSTHDHSRVTRDRWSRPSATAFSRRS